MHPCSLSYYGYFTPFGGYGIANLNWVTHLSRLGVDVSCHPKFTYSTFSLEWQNYTKEQQEILSKPFVKHRVGIVESTPYDFDTNESEIKIANTMCESSRIGEPWVNKCNAMDYVVVPNEWNKKVFEESGVVVPIFVIPHGVDTDFWKPVDIEPGKVNEKEKPFTFGIVGYLNERKGVFDVIRAFASEFALQENVRLVLKSSNPGFGYYSHFSDPRIQTINTNLSRDGLYQLFSDFDCFVFPSKAEGIGYPPREAMAMGIPTIVGNYSGLADLANPDHCFPINPVGFREGVNPQSIEQPGAWADYDIAEIMYWMRWVFENRDQAKKIALAGAENIRDNFNWDVCAKKMLHLLQEIT